jgi:proteasome lid subunit RPN8/RPN11
MLSGKQLKAIYEDCQRTYPKEAVGVIIGPPDLPHQDRVLVCRNVLGELHRLDPEQHPRDAASGFAINPQRLLLIDAETRAKGWRIKLIYHSHPDTTTDLSPGDRENALDFQGAPLHPNVEYMIVAVENGKAVGHAFHRWDDERKDFVRADEK